MWLHLIILYWCVNSHWSLWFYITSWKKPLKFVCVQCKIFKLKINFEEIWKFKIKKHKLSYFTGVWNVLDILIICMAIVAMCFNVYRQVKVNDMLDNLIANDNVYMDFDFLCYWSIFCMVNSHWSLWFYITIYV
jgi:multisubunit Na+/H+ antiporter MnhF subunit